MTDFPPELKILVDKGMGRYMTSSQTAAIPAGVGGTVDLTFAPTSDDTYWIVFRKVYGNTLTNTFNIREIFNLCVPLDMVNVPSRVSDPEDTWLYVSKLRPFTFRFTNLTAVAQNIDITFFMVQTGTSGFNYLRTLLLGHEQMLLGYANYPAVQDFLKSILQALGGGGLLKSPETVEQDAE